MIISWTYLLHAYYAENGIEYRKYSGRGTGKRFVRKANGDFEYLSLTDCLDNKRSPVDSPVAANLKFLIGLRNEVSHRGNSAIDKSVSAKLQANCLNYNDFLIANFGEKWSIAPYLEFSIQFVALSRNQIRISVEDLPHKISDYIASFERSLPPHDFADDRYAYRIIFTHKLTNNVGKADEVVEFVPAESGAGSSIISRQVAIKETERKKYRPGEIVAEVQKAGYSNFTMHQHTTLWKELDARNPSKGFGVTISKTWYWYELWLKEVLAQLKGA